MDGLRGIFVLAVLLFHAEISWAPGGFLGVSSFFTLSGFLITRLLIDERRATGAIDLGRFWTRRARRLMPASLVTLGLLLLFARTIATVGQLSALRGDVLSALTYVSNWRFMTQARSYFEIFDRPSPAQHFWSLSIEEQFYLGYPLLVVAVWRWSATPMRALAVVLAALVGVGVASGIALTTAGVAPSRVYYGTDTRAPELLVGALLALWTAGDRDDTTYRASRDVAAALGAIVLVAGIGWTSEDATTLPYGGLLANAIATAALVHAGTRPSRAGRLLAAAPLVWLGRVSYGVYLYHWPVYLWLDANRTGLTTAPLFALRAGVTIAMAAVSYVAIERPVRRGGALAGRRLWLATLTSAAAIAGGVVWVTQLPSLAMTATIAMQEQHMPTPESPETIRVLVVGDSVANNMAVGLQTWAPTARTPIALWDLAASACAIGRGGERPTLRRFPQLRNHCRNWATL